jgi:hypothetical protein
VQLAEGSVHELESEKAAEVRQQTLVMIGKFERRMRATTVALVDELMLGWKQFASAR